MKKKKLMAAVLSLAIAGSLCVGLSACGGSKDNDPYYNKTYTISGTCTIDWDSKYTYDNYAQDYSKKVSQREIIENHWNEIDWDKTAEWNQFDADNLPAHGTVEEFIASFKDFEENGYKDIAGFKVSVSGKDNPTLTLTLTESMMQYPGISSRYAAEISMPLCETAEQFAANKPFNGYENMSFRSFDSAGYSGLGVYKTEDNHVLTVDFNVEKFIKNIHLTIIDYELDAEGGYIGQETLLSGDTTVMMLYDTNGNSILGINYLIDFEVTNN